MNFKVVSVWNHFFRGVGCTAILFYQLQAQAQLALVSVTPANGAVNVPLNSSVVFTFNEAMNTVNSTAYFFAGLGNIVPVTYAWSSGNTVLTCSPLANFPNNTNIIWELAAISVANEFVTPTGSFSTGANGSGANGTNAITLFEVGMEEIFTQTSTSQPVPDGTNPYIFLATTVLASNRFATNISLALPTSVVTNLSPLYLEPWDYNLASFGLDLAALNAAYPPGNYNFTVRATSSNQTVTVNYPSTLVQPPAPHISNFTAAQAVNPTQPFTLTWDPFAGGTAADFITVSLGNPQGEITLSTNVLTGTTTSILIPAGTLQPNTNYDVDVSFTHLILTTNGNSYVTEAFRVTSTTLSLTTLGGSNNSLPVSAPTFSNGFFGFTVLTSPGQTVVVEYKTSLTAAWQTYLTTNNPVSPFSVRIPISSNPAGYFRARLGP